MSADRIYAGMGSGCVGSGLQMSNKPLMTPHCDVKCKASGGGHIAVIN